MEDRDKEEELLRSVAIQNAKSILAARQRAEQELIQAKEALEAKTVELAHSLSMMQATLDCTSDAILAVDEVGAVTDFNEKFIEMWQIPRDLMELRKPRQLAQAISRQLRDPAQFLAKLEEIYFSFPPETFDLLELVDGRTLERFSKIRWLEGRNVGRVWSFRDITARRQAEEALRDESRLLELLNTTGTLIASELNLQTLLQSVTDAATEISGAKFGAFFYNARHSDGGAYTLYTLSGASREAFEKLGHPRATPLFSATFNGDRPIRSDNVLKDPRYGGQAPYRGMPSGHLPVRSYLAVPVVSRSGEVIGGLFFGHPEVGVFTERIERIIVGIAAQAAIAIDNARLYEAAQKAAAERARLLESERSARQLAEEQNKSKDTFLAMLGHELRNPLSAISAGVAVVKAAGPGSEKSARAYDIIARQSAHLERIVNDLLDTARMLAGKVTLVKQRVDLAEAVKACIQALEAAGRTEGYRLDVSLQTAILDADSARIDQIINNLITNALKYTPAGGTIRVRVTIEEDTAELEVADDGIGIAPDLLSHVFDPFVQGASSLDRSQGGLGIGLTLVRKLAELHGGSASAASGGAGCGSTFTVRFPLAAMHAEPASLMTSTAKADRACILIIEDNPDALEMTSAVLEMSDYRVLQAGNGSEGLALAKNGRPHAAIMDIGLADLDGYEIARRLRADPETRDIGLIALTGYGSPEDIRSAIAAGFDTHLVKPVNLDQLLDAVEKCVSSRRMRDEPVG